MRQGNHSCGASEKLREQNLTINWALLCMTKKNERL
jgi:hypothetical protein